MKLKLLISFLLLALGTQAQTTIDQQYYNRSRSSNIWDRVGSDSILFAPRVKATKGKNEGSIVYNRYLRTLEVYDSTTAKWYILAPIAVFDGLISGGNVSWTGTGLNFYISESVYVIGGVLYNGNDTTVTLAASDPDDPRLDVIGLNENGVFVLTGTPAADPAKPQVTPTEEIELTSILIGAGVTTPGGIAQEVIYDENAEWTVATSNITANADNTTLPYRLTKSIDVSSYGTSAGRTITFTKGSLVDMTQFSLLTLYVRLKADYVNTATIGVQFRTSSNINLSYTNTVVVSNSNYNYVMTNDGVYQTIQIPMSAFTFSSVNFNTSPTMLNRLVLTFNGAGDGMYIDYINLQGGLSVPLAGVNSFNGRGGNVISVKDDYDQWFIDTTYRRADSVFAMKNSVELFQYKDSTGGGGSSYTFSNGLTESAGAVTLGGALTSATQLWNNPFKYSYALSGTDSVVVQTNYAGSWRVDKYGTGAANNLIVGNNMYFELNDGTSQSAGFEFLKSGMLTRFQDSRTVKTGLEYTHLDTTGQTSYTLITKNYLNQRLQSFSGGVPYTLINGGNNLGSGAQVFKDTSSNKLNLRSILQGWNTNITQNTNDITISVDTTTQTITDGATVTFDANAGVSAKVTLGGNRTLAFSNFRNGMFLSLLVIQDGTGSRTLTLPASTRVINNGAGAVTLTTAASSHDILTFWKINDVIYCNYGKNYN